MRHFYNINEIKIDLQRVYDSLNRGKIIIYPADTLHGFGIDPRNISACRNLKQLKKRKDSKGMILLASDFKMVKENVEIRKKAISFLKEFWPGPLTVVLKSKNKNLNEILENGSLAIRIPDNEFTLKFISKYNFPIVSTSVNKSKDKPIIDIESVNDYFQNEPLWNEVEYVLKDDKLLKEDLPSTIIDLRDDHMKILREGKINANILREKWKKFNMT